MAIPAHDHTAAPFVSRPMEIEKDWIDYNGHLNMAYYNVLFDRCWRRGLRGHGDGSGLRASDRRLTIYTAEVHVCYVQELHLEPQGHGLFQLLDHDDKRLRVYQEIRHAEGWLAATSESLSLHVDMGGPKVAPFPADMRPRSTRCAPPMPVCRCRTRRTLDRYPPKDGMSASNGDASTEFLNLRITGMPR